MYKKEIINLENTISFKFEDKAILRRSLTHKSFDKDDGLSFSNGDLNLKALAALAEHGKEPELVSGKQELFESLINKYI